MKEFMPLKRLVVDVTHEAESENPQEVRRAVKRWHNRFSYGSLPRTLVVKIGGELYVDLKALESWLEDQKQKAFYHGPGRPRSP